MQSACVSHRKWSIVSECHIKESFIFDHIWIDRSPRLQTDNFRGEELTLRFKFIKNNWRKLQIHRNSISFSNLTCTNFNSSFCKIKNHKGKHCILAFNCIQIMCWRPFVSHIEQWVKVQCTTHTIGLQAQAFRRMFEMDGLYFLC